MTNQEIITTGQTIANETHIGGNTAERVGGVIKAIGENLTELAGNVALGAIYDVSAKNPTAGSNNDGKFESLSALLSDANLNTLIPTANRKGGMSIKFVQSSDNKYVQYFLTKNEWSTRESDWEKINLEKDVDLLGQLIYNRFFIGKGNTAVTIKINGVLPNHNYRLYVLNPNWDMTGVTSTGVSKLSAYYNVSGTRTYITYVDISGTVSSYYDFTTPAAIDDYIYIGGRAAVGEKPHFLLVDRDYTDVTNYINQKYSLDNIHKEHYDLANLFEMGSIMNISSGNNYSYVDSTTRMRTKATSKIWLHQGDVISSIANDLKIYVAEFRPNGSAAYTGWTRKHTILADCNAIIVAKYNEDVGTLDFNYGVSNIVFESKKQSLTNYVLNEVEINNIEALAGTRLTATCKLQFPKHIVDKPTPSILTYMAEYTGSNSPYITIQVGAYVSLRYIIKNGEIQQIRIPPILPNMTSIMTITVPKGGTVTFKSVDFTRDLYTDKNKCGIRLNSHLGFLRYAPEQTKIAFEMSAMMGYKACICNPIKTSDGVWMCYHENKKYLSPDGTLESRIQLSGTEFNAKTYAEIQQYSVMPYKGMSDIWGGQPVPTLDEFLEVCSKTSMRPVFSVHPDIDSAGWQTIREKLIKYNLLGDTSVKLFSTQVFPAAFDVLGNDIESYIIITYLTTEADAESLVTSLTSSPFTGVTCRLGIELGDSSALTAEIIGTFVEAGLYVTIQSISPTDTNYYEDMMEIGASEFTDDALPNTSLNW